MAQVHSLALLEWSQACSLLAFAVSVRGPEDGFPALLGVSVRSRRAGEVDLSPQEVEHPETMVCLVERPEQLGDVDGTTRLRYSGEVTFALWPDKTYRSELARIPWRGWEYLSCGSHNPDERIEHDFTAMRERYASKPFWNARRLQRTPRRGPVQAEESLNSQALERTRMDVYAEFAELDAAEREAVDFCVRVVRRENARTVVLAPHGGGIEPGTSEVASKIADDDLSLTIFEGIKSTGNARLYIASTNFDEPRCLELVQAADHVVAIHGGRGEEPVTFLGGRDTRLGQHICVELERYGYNVRAHGTPELQGMAATNICNRGRRGAGVQLELSSGLRETFFESLTAAGRRKPTYELTKFAGLVRAGLRAAGAL